MLRKNLPLYILVVLTLAALIFLSPKIIGIISADTNEPIPTGKEILVNNKFDLEPLNNQIWLTAAASTNSMVTSSPGYVSATCGKAEGDFVKISQKAPVSAGKFYKLSISYINEPNETFGKAQFGFLKDGPTANVIESKSIDFAAGSSEFVAYAAPKLNHENSYFFFKCTGIGTIKIKNLSLEEFQIMPAAMITTTVTSVAQTAQVAQSSVTRTPAPSATPSLSTTATPSPTPSPTPTPNNTPAQTITAEPISQAPPAEQTTILSGWNILGNSEDVSSELFTSKNMTAMQMLGGKWVKLTPSSKKATVLSKSGGIYVFNPSKSSKYVSLETASSQSSLVAGKGWNILYNSSDQAVSTDNLKYNFKVSGKSGMFSVAELLSQNKASSSAYLLKQTASGVSLTKINLAETKLIPAKTSFWFYLFAL